VAAMTLQRIRASEPRSRRYTIADGGRGAVPGLRVVVHPSGAKVWELRYRWRGERRTQTLGRADVVGVGEARAAARERLRAVARGEDPRRARVITVADLLDRYLADEAPHRLRNSTIRDYRESARLHIVPALGRRDAADLPIEAVDRWHKSLADRPVAANRAAIALSSAYAWAVRIELVPRNPCKGVRLYRPRHRERYLSDDEYAAMWRELDAYRGNPSAVAAIKLLALTGLRHREVLALEWRDVDERAGTLRLRASKTGARTVPVSDAALGLVLEQPRRDVYVFPRVRGGRMWSVTDPWSRIRSRAGLEDVRLHDLRHSFASRAVRQGVPLIVVRDLLGHSSIQTTQRYSHVDDGHLREAASRTMAGLPSGGERRSSSTSTSTSASASSHSTSPRANASAHDAK